MPEKSDPSPALSGISRRRRPPLAWVGNGFLIIVAVLAAYVLVSNLARNPIEFLQNVLDGLKLGCVYALMAIAEIGRPAQRAFLVTLFRIAKLEPL